MMTPPLKAALAASDCAQEIVFGATCRFSSAGCLASLAEDLHFTQHGENHNLKEEVCNQAIILTFAVFVHICCQVTS